MIISPDNWQPTSTISMLQKRAAIISTIRHFFEKKNVWEVETPLLSRHGVTCPYLDSVEAKVHMAGEEAKTYYLQTSPEYCMKRLLASDSGSIYQLTKAFRDNEMGRFHNIEFTMLEWYRVGFDHHALMQEVDELLQLILGCPPAIQYTYRDIFEEKFNINPHCSSSKVLRGIAHDCGLSDVAGINPEDSDVWLQRLMNDIIEPSFVGPVPVMIYDFPASQAALSQVRHEEDALASRFEVYCEGMELANGFHELTDFQEQKARFMQDRSMRKILKLSDIDIDNRLLAALEHGLPPCAGVALGVDRLVMLALGAKDIQSVIAFPTSRA